MMKKIYIMVTSIIMTVCVLLLCKTNAYAGNEHSSFLNIGSVSKVYTVTAVMQLKEQGKIDIDSPLTEYIPEFVMADERYKDITVRMLMNHTAGFMGTIYGGGFLFDKKSSDYHNEFLNLLRSRRNYIGCRRCMCIRLIIFCR